MFYNNITGLMNIYMLLVFVWVIISLFMVLFLNPVIYLLSTRQYSGCNKSIFWLLHAQPNPCSARGRPRPHSCATVSTPKG